MSRAGRGVPIGGNKQGGNRDTRDRSSSQEQMDVRRILGRGLHLVNGVIEVRLARGAMNFTSLGELEWQALPPLTQASPARLLLDDTLKQDPRTNKLGVKASAVVRSGEGTEVDSSGRVGLALDRTQFETVMVKGRRVVRFRRQMAYQAPLALTVSSPPTQGELQQVADDLDALKASLRSIGLMEEA